MMELVIIDTPRIR